MAEKGHTKPAYRRDIDGLRAIAVLLVVLDHLMFRHFEGGYIGVDVFFVISGYLIGSSLIAEFRQGTFSLLGFYERRARRIFPALLVILIIVTVLAYWFLLPRPLVDYCRSLLAAVFSFSNFLFFRQAGYFDAPSADKPLLHTWSLGVEEQFYFFFPLLLFVVFRLFPKALRSVLWCLAIVTLLLSAYFVRANPTAAFFWSPLRAWELLIGVLVSQHRWSWLRSAWVRHVTGVAGLLLILVPGLTYTPDTPFPGLAALWPCLGTAMVIGVGQEGPSIAGRLLSLQPLTFIGLISYSLYLWHWPIVAFQRTGLLISSRPLWERNTKLSILVLSLIFATLSWWLVETPFRKGRWRPKRKPLFLLTGAVAGLIAITAAVMIHAGGFPQRFSPDVLKVGNYSQYNMDAALQMGTCFLLPPTPVSDTTLARCLQPEAGKRNVVVYGDSTAAHLYVGLVRVFPEIHFELLSSAGCHPYQDVSDVEPPFRAHCEAIRQFIHFGIPPSHKPDAVIVASFWSVDSPANLGDEIAAFRRQNIPVILIGPIIDFDQALPLLLSREIRYHALPAQAALDFSGHLSEGSVQIDSVMADKAQTEWHVPYVSYFKTLCNAHVLQLSQSQWKTSEDCPLLVPGGAPLLYDRHHFTLEGSVFFAEQMRANGVL